MTRKSALVRMRESGPPRLPQHSLGRRGEFKKQGAFALFRQREFPQSIRGDEAHAKPIQDAHSSLCGTVSGLASFQGVMDGHVPKSALERLALAEWRVAESERRVRSQRKLMLNLAQEERDTEEAMGLLFELVQILALQVETRDRLIAQLSAPARRTKAA